MGRTIIRARFDAPTDVWIEHLQDVFKSVTAYCQGDVSTCPGPIPGEVDWFFQNSCDAMWFMLKYSGHEVTYEYDRYGTGPYYEHDET